MEKKEAVLAGKGSVALPSANVAAKSAHSFAGEPTCDVCHTKTTNSHFCTNCSNSRFRGRLIVRFDESEYDRVRYTRTGRLRFELDERGFNLEFWLSGWTSFRR